MIKYLAMIAAWVGNKDLACEQLADVIPRLDQEIRVPYDLPQTSLRLAYPGVPRDDPQFFAAFLMNHIFGGGTFTSRLFDEVREKRGLAYGVDSSLINSDHSIAGTLVELQLDGLGIDYVQRRKAEIEAVTPADVKAAAQRLLLAEPAVMIVGPAGPEGGKG